MQMISEPIAVSQNQEYLLAVARDVDANALGATTLVYQNNLNAANSAPLLIRVIRKSGVISLLAFTISLNGVVVKTVSASVAAFLGSTNNQLLFKFDSILDGVAFGTTGNYTITVGTINLSSSTIDCEIYGLKLT